MLEKWTWAQVYAVIVAPGLVVAGLVGFLFDTGFGSGRQLHGNTDLIWLFRIEGVADGASVTG